MSELGPSPLAARDKHLSVDEARTVVARSLAPIAGDERVDLADALGRVLAHDLLSPIDVPAHDNSAMDGYAFDGALLEGGLPLELPVRGIVYAGTPYGGPTDRRAALRIMTGAVMPEGCDTVVPHELVTVLGEDRVRFAADVVRRGENRRRRGEDLSRHRPALHAGRRLTPADLGLIASLGLQQVDVRRRLRVALFSTGDELRSPGEPLAPGCVYDSNRTSLAAAIRRLDMEVVDLGLVADDPAALRAALEAGCARADVVITSGGVSAGDADYTRAVLAELGDVSFWKVAMRPGRPFAFGPLRAGRAATHVPTDSARRESGRRTPGGSSSPGPVSVEAARDGTPPVAPAPGEADDVRWLFALPGNPVAALVTFYVFAREALLMLAGATPRPLPMLRARSLQPIRKRPGRTEFQRAFVTPGADGWEVQSTGSQGAGILRSMSEANALLVLGHDQGSVAAGEFVDVWLFDGLT